MIKHKHNKNDMEEKHAMLSAAAHGSRHEVGALLGSCESIKLNKAIDFISIGNEFGVSLHPSHTL